MSRALGCLVVVATVVPPAGAVRPKPTTTFAVVEVIRRHVECSGAGGEHYVLRIHDGSKSPRFAHAGGHALYLDLLPRNGGPSRSAFFVAELEPRRFTISNPGWCIYGLPAFDASARWLYRARSARHAEHLRSRVAARGPGGPSRTGGTDVLDLESLPSATRGTR